MSQASHYPEITILDTLTSEGSLPLELCFVLRRTIYRWHPTSESLSGFMLDDYQFANACRDYLRARGQCFNDPTELAAWAKSHNWPNLDSFLLHIRAW